MPLTIWRFTDKRAGHDSQSNGLCNAIAEQVNSEIIDIDITQNRLSIQEVLLNKYIPGNVLPAPDLLIGAGHKTHFSMLLARRTHGGKIIVIMRPTLPCQIFDYCIIPEHDEPQNKHNIIVTYGAINSIKQQSAPDPNIGLILIGGPSRHYGWDKETLIEMLDKIINEDKSIKWTISDSPRTPSDASRLIQQKFIKTTYVYHKDCEHDWLKAQLNVCGKIWITEDSISMIYEALTAGAKTGVIPVPDKKNGKIKRNINKLRKDKMITNYNDWLSGNELVKPATPLAEVNRCVKYLADQGLF